MIDKLTRYRIKQFRVLWNNNANEYEFFELAKKIDNRITFCKFDKGWQYCTIKNDIFSVAKDEFLIAINELY